MNKVLILVLSIFGILVAFCGAKDTEFSGCSASRSEDVFHGLFKIEDVKKVVILKSNQKSVYPVPELKKDDAFDSFEDREFFAAFKKALHAPDNRNAKMEKKADSGFHIFVYFKSGKNACLHGRVSHFGFIVEPMFNGNSFSGRNNELYNVIMLWRNKTT